MSTTKRLPRAQRREQILQVATEVFAEKGYHPASMDDIANAAGVSKPVLYQHFESKTELFSTVMDTAIAELAHRMTVILNTVDSREERVYSTFRGYFQFVAENRAAFIVLTRCSNETLETQMRWRNAVESYVRLIAASIQERNNIGKIQAYILGRAIVGMGEEVAQVCVDFDDIDVEQVTRLTAEFAFKGLSQVQAPDFQILPAGHDFDLGMPAESLNNLESLTNTTTLGTGATTE